MFGGTIMKYMSSPVVRAHLKTMMGGSIGETVCSILQRIGENSLWCMFSLKGSKDIAEGAHGCEYTVASCREAIRSYLKNAPARKGGKKHNISAEFTRLVSMDLSKSFYEGLDKHASKLLYLYRSSRYADIAERSAILESPDKNATNHRKRVAVLLGLPLSMPENPSQFLKICEHTGSEEELIKGVTVGIITVVDDMMDPIPCDCSDVALVIEEVVVLCNRGDVPNAFVNLMGLLYALNINYPQNFKYTFEVIQRLFMNIGADACSARVHSLKNKLLK